MKDKHLQSKLDAEERRHYENLYRDAIEEGYDDADAELLSFFRAKKAGNERKSPDQKTKKTSARVNDDPSLSDKALDSLKGIFQRMAEERPFDDLHGEDG